MRAGRGLLSGRRSVDDTDADAASPRRRGRRKAGKDRRSRARKARRRLRVALVLFPLLATVAGQLVLVLVSIVIGGSLLGGGGAVGGLFGGGDPASAPPDIPYADVFDQTAALGIDPALVAAVAWQESGFAADVIDCERGSSAGAVGIMQFLPSTAAGIGIDPCDPEEAIPGGARYLLAQYEAFGSWELALAAYNAGPGTVDRCRCVPRNGETEVYVERIMAKWAEYRAMAGAGPLGAAGGDGTGLGPVTLTDVRLANGATFPMHTSVAARAQAMIDAAGADGLVLTGSGYRSGERQIELRREHCGTSDYDIYERPSSECSPPTARPGTSNHEQGLAMDLQCAGTLIEDHGDPCFVWLDARAAAFGFANLPSEPWHWSVDGT